MPIIQRREEHPEGFEITVDPASHTVLDGLPEKWPVLLGYNKLIARPGAEVPVQYHGDPIIALGSYGKGRSFVWASDCAPHWMPAEFCESDCNRRLWRNLLTWAVNK